MDGAPAAPPSADADGEWSYRGGKLILAPMVRVNSLAFRTVCAEYGCDMLHSEEIVARSLVESKRTENAALGTVDFTSSEERGGGRVIFRVKPRERVVRTDGCESSEPHAGLPLSLQQDVAVRPLNHPRILKHDAY